MMPTQARQRAQGLSEFIPQGFYIVQHSLLSACTVRYTVLYCTHPCGPPPHATAAELQGTAVHNRLHSHVLTSRLRLAPGQAASVGVPARHAGERRACPLPVQAGGAACPLARARADLLAAAGPCRRMWAPPSSSRRRRPAQRQAACPPRPSGLVTSPVTHPKSSFPFATSPSPPPFVHPLFPRPPHGFLCSSRLTHPFLLPSSGYWCPCRRPPPQAAAAHIYVP